MNTARLWRQGRDQLAAWLPVLVMMLFALGSWWLVRSAPRIGPADGGPPPSAEPDYFMREFSVRSFDADGRLTSELVGVEGQHHPLTDTLAVQQPRIRSFDEQGNPTLASAQRALAKGDGSEAELFGKARVVREAVTSSDGRVVPRMEFLGEYLHAFIDEDRVSSDKPVELRRGADVFTGDRFSYDDRSGVAVLTGQVRGVLQPRR